MTTPPNDNPKTRVLAATDCPTCPATESLIAILEDLTIDEPYVAAHLETCESCRQRIDALAGLPYSPGLARGEHPALDPLSPANVDVTPDADLQRALAAAHAATPTPIPDSPTSDDLQFLAPARSPGYIGSLGPYDIIQAVGQGGMGIVLKAHDPSLDRVVAIKVLAPATAASPAARKRFVREARAAAAVSHEHVVTIHAVDEAPGTGLPYLVMQFIGGRSLEARIAATGPLRLEEILRIGMQMASGLAAAHAQGLVHRDIKPANIMLENGVERVKITDFGLARAADPADAAVTATGQVTGTPMYMAPEQARGERVDHRSDLFSLGGVLYAMCTGRPPFPGNAHPLSILRKVCEDEPPPPNQLNESIPDWLAEIVRRLMHKDPAQRPQSATAVADELAEHLSRIQSPSAMMVGAPYGPGPGRGRQSRTKAPRKRRVLLGCVLTCVVALAIVVLTDRAGLTQLRRGLLGSKTGASAQPSAQSEPAIPAPSVTPTTAAFVLIAPSANPRPFPTLAGAVAAASPGDTIELRTSDRIATPRVDLSSKPLAIRAAAGFSPVLVQSQPNQSIFTTRAPLVLEGLTLDGTADDSPEAIPQGSDPGGCLVLAAGRLQMTNCRLIARGPQDARFACLRLIDAPAAEIRNSELHTFRGVGIQWYLTPGHAGTLRLKNSASASRSCFVIRNESDLPATLDADGCTFFSGYFLSIHPEARPQHFTIDLARTVISSGRTLWRAIPGDTASADPTTMPFTWKDARCVFDTGRPGSGLSDPTPNPPDDGSDAQRPAHTDNSLEAVVRFKGQYRHRFSMQQIPVADDFDILNISPPEGRRLQPRALDSVGIQPALVGPGRPYDTFRNSAAYVAWQQQAEAALR